MGRSGPSSPPHENLRCCYIICGSAEKFTQIQSDRSSLLFHPVCRSGGKLFHCRSPLSLVPQSTSITWERTASRRRPAFSSHLIASAFGNVNIQRVSKSI